MVKFVLPLVGALLASAAVAAPSPNHVYELSGSYADGYGGTPLTGQAGAIFTGLGDGAGLTFLADKGPSLAATLGSVYSIETFFQFDAFTGNNGFNKIIDFLGDDGGVYNRAGRLNFYRGGVGTVTETGVVFAPAAMAHVVITRDAGSMVKGYVDGQLGFSFVDSLNLAPGTTTLRFFDDDASTNSIESAAGFVDFIRTYDFALSSSDVTMLYNNGTPLRFAAGAVPEPASWALMVGGFGLVGGTLRRARRFGRSFA